jgi:hypothetical protein
MIKISTFSFVVKYTGIFQYTKLFGNVKFSAFRPPEITHFVVLYITLIRRILAGSINPQSSYAFSTDQQRSCGFYW